MIIETVLRLISQPVYAAGEPPRLEQLVESIESIFEYVFPAGALLAVAMIIYGGYMWIMSGGDPARTQQAQGVLTWSVIGLVFLFLIKAILTAILQYIYI